MDKIKGKRLKHLSLFLSIFHLCFGIMNISVNAAGGNLAVAIQETEDIQEIESIASELVEETESVRERETEDESEMSLKDVPEGETDELLMIGSEEDSDNKNLQTEVEQDTQEWGNAKAQNGLTLLLNENADLLEVKSILKGINSSFVLTCIEEINLIYIESEEEIKEDEIMSNRIIYQATLEYGELAGIEQEGITLTDIQVDNTAISLESIEEEIDSDIENIELLSLMAWHIDDVTDERNSLEISTGNGIEIALIDSGIDYLHPLLVDKVNMRDAKSYIPEEVTISDTNGHGTMVAGVIAQIAPDAKITPYRVIGESTGDSLWTIEAIVQATNDGKDIINMSLGTYKSINDSSENLTVMAFERAVNYAASKGVILVSSAGNNGMNLDANYQENFIRHLPGSLEGIIAVSATTRGRDFASYSNYGSNVDFVAPGGDIILVDGMYDLSEWIYTTYPLSVDNGLGVLGIPQGYTFSVGTSLAAPAMTAGIANLMTHYKNMTGEIATKEVVLGYFAESALDLGTPGYDIYYGNGKIDIYRALSMVEDKVSPHGEIVYTTVEINTHISAEELVINISDNNDQPEDIQIYFETAYSFNELGEKEVVVVLEDMSGNKSYLSGMIAVIDTIAPTGQAQQVTVYQGEELDVSQLVKNVQDNAGADQVEIRLITEFDSLKIGVYPLVVSLRDSAGNETLIETEVMVQAFQKQEDDVEIEPPLMPSQDANTNTDELIKVNYPLPVSNSKVSTSKGSGNVKTASVNTGDENNILLLIGIMLVSASVGVVALKKKNKEVKR